MNNIRIIITSHNNLSYNYETNLFFNDVLFTDVMRYFKGFYPSVNVFKEKVLDPLKPFIEIPVNEITEKWVIGYENATSFSYDEAFKIKNDNFRILVFQSININEMIENLGSKRIKVDGKQVKRKQFDINGEFTGYKEYDVIYETYEIYGEKLGLTNNVFAVKCWCTSTNKEHWIWIDEKYKENPLEAIASTFFVPEKYISSIKELKRHGDILLIEYNDDLNIMDIDFEKEKKVPLTADQYFALLTAES